MVHQQARRRGAARVLLLDERDRVLLLHGHDPADPTHRYWFTPGGGLEAAESPAQAAARELFEETGRRVDPCELHQTAFRECVDIPFDGAIYRQDQCYFALRVPAFTVVHAALEANERRSLDGHRWWPLDELRRTDENVYPERLPDMLASLIGQNRSQ